MNIHKLIAILLGGIVIIAVVAVLKILQPIIVPMVIAIMLSYIIEPLVTGLTKIKMPRIIAIVIVLIILFGFFYLVGLFVYSSINSLVREYPKYESRFESIYREVNTFFSDKLPVSIHLFEDVNWSFAFRDRLVAVSGSFVNFLKTLFVIIVYLVFLLLEKPLLKKKLAKAFQMNMNLRIGRILDHINQDIGRYLIIKLLISLATGILFWVSFTIIGLDFALIWGVLTVLFNFIPSIGSIIITLACVLWSVIQFYPAWGPIIAVAATGTVIQNVIGSFLDPKISGDQLNVSPLLVLFSLFFWGWIWGIVGMFLAVPLTVMIKIICENVPALQPISVIMGNGREKRERRTMREER